MPSSWVAVANTALTKLGARQITTLNDAVKSARLCKQHLMDRAELVYASFDWSSVTGRVVLSPLDEAVPFGYTYTFEKPADCVSVREVNGSTFGYRVEGNRILYTGNTIQLKYTKNITDVSQLEAELCECIAFDLAAHICIALNNDKGLKDRIEADYRRYRQGAYFHDSKQDAHDELEVNTWTGARHGGFQPTQSERS